MANQVYETRSLILSLYLRNLMLAGLAARPAAALWATPKVVLVKDPAFNPTPNSVLATLAAMKCDFSGYADQTPVLAGPYNDGPNTQVEISSVVFAATTATPFVGNTVSGYYLTDGTEYIGGERFPTGSEIVIGSPGDFVEIDLLVPLGYRQDV